MLAAVAGGNVVIGMFIGVVIMSAMIVVLTVLYTKKHTPKKGIIQTQPQPIQNKEANPTSGGESARRKEKVKGTENLPAWKKTRLILKAMRSLRKRNTPPDQPPIEEELAVDERHSMPLPDVTGPQPEINTMPYSTEPEVSNVELVNGRESDVNTINALPTRAEQEASSVEPVNEESPDVNIINDLTASREQEVSSMEPVNDERSTVNMGAESELGEQNEAAANEAQKQETTTGDLSDLFTEEVAEESDTGKLAKRLSDVDILDLMREGQNFVKDIKGTKG